MIEKLGQFSRCLFGGLVIVSCQQQPAEPCYRGPPYGQPYGSPPYGYSPYGAPYGPPGAAGPGTPYPYFYGGYPPPPPEGGGPVQVKVTNYDTPAPTASTPLYRVERPSEALASPCDEGCGGNRCDVATNRCIHPCRSNADCKLGYSCLPVGANQAALCVWP